MNNQDTLRVPVEYRWDALNWEFLKLLAEIAHYAQHRYGKTEQYTNSRLEGEKSPVNHMVEHMRSYIAREPYDHFDGDPRYHLAAIAYNAMIEFFYLTHGGPTVTDAFVGGSALDKDDPLEAFKRAQAEGMRNANAPVIDDNSPLRRHARPILPIVSDYAKALDNQIDPSTPSNEDPKSILSRLFNLGGTDRRAA